jgi:ligand-binding sensor domain-containing protein/two-component sensor histidine kinase
MHLNKIINFVLLFCSCLISFTSTCFAQYEEKDFTRYTVKDGLSDNYIKCLQQDSSGYLWVGTDMGLNRFDGDAFKNFFQGSKEISLASSNIFQLKSFGPDKLGILSIGGFQMLNTHNFSIQNYFIPGMSTITSYQNGILDAVPLQGKKILLSASMGIYVLDSNSKIIFRYDAKQQAGRQIKSNIYGRSIFEINDREYLVYVDERGLGYYSSVKNSFKEVSNVNEWKNFQHPLPPYGDGWLTQMQMNKDEFLFIHFSRDSIIYYNHALNKRIASALPIHVSSVFTWESKIQKMDDSSFAINDGQAGFYKFHLDRKTGGVIFSPKKYLPQYKIINLFVDRDKRLWVGTTQGLLQQKLHPPFLEIINFPVAAKDTITGGISCIYPYKNKLYVGRFSRHFGLLIVDAATMKAEKQVNLFGKNNMWNEIRSIQMYHPDTLWLGTNTGIIWFDTKSEHYGKVTDARNPTALKDFSATLAPPRSDGYAWLCKVLGGVVARYHIPTRTFDYFTVSSKPALPFSRVKSIAYDSYGDVWIGGHGLARWNNSKQDFDTLINVYAGINKYYDDIVTLSADERGSLWLHNAYNDLLEYKIKQKLFVDYAAKNGLPIGEIRTLSPVKNNLLWIANHSNLTLFDTYTKKIKVFDHYDGLPDERPTSRNMYFDSITGFMFLPVNNSLVKFPQRYIEKPERGSSLLIQELMVNNNKTFFNPGDNIRLKADENNLSLYFTVIDFEERNNYRFAYMLNAAEGWTDIGLQRNINLTGLSSGKYLIQIKAVSKSGLIKTKAFSFSISPPFWKTAGFIFAVNLFLVALAIFLYRYRIKQIKQKANLDKLLAQTEMKALHAQMNPHFIFNSLNSIREMILNNENKEASHFLGKFAQLIRLTLDQSGKAFISLRHTIDYLTRYMEMEQIRNEQFTCRILADDELDIDETFLPPMLIQPFIENALWHGTKADDKKININIDFKKVNKEVLCLIEDNGVGIEASLKQKQQTGSNHISVGITNIKNRIQLLNEKYNLKSLLSIEDKKNLPGFKTSGTLVTLRLPIKSGNDD